MEPHEIQARIGTRVSADEMAEMIKSQRPGTSPNDVRVCGGVLSFSFGPSGVILTGAEQRTPLKQGGA